MWLAKTKVSSQPSILQKKGAYIMAAEKSINDIKLQIQVENGTNSAGNKALKNLNYNQIKLTSTDEELLAAGQAIVGLTDYTLSGVRLVNTYDLTASE